MAVNESYSYLHPGLAFDLAFDTAVNATMAASGGDDAGGGLAGLLNDSSPDPAHAVTAVPADGTGILAQQLNVPYAVCEALVAVVAVAGNALVILAFQRERRLRRRTNYYIVSLAVADLLVGLLGIPFALLASVGLPHNLHACLFTVSLLIVLCTISIFCLVAVSVDRYWAILHPLGYSRNVSTRKAVGEYTSTPLRMLTLLPQTRSVSGQLKRLGWTKGSPSVSTQAENTPLWQVRRVLARPFLQLSRPPLGGTSPPPFPAGANRSFSPDATT